MYTTENARSIPGTAGAWCGFLPPKHVLLLAFCGREAPGPLVRQARLLAELHRRRREEPMYAPECDCRRTELIADIDRWVADHAPPPHQAAHTGTETIGALLDVMAAAAVRALVALADPEHGPRSEQMHHAWWRLGELELRYADLAAAVTDGRCRLPIEYRIHRDRKGSK